jgi:hypothetical protein
MFWLLFLPFKLAFGLVFGILFLPLLIVRLVLKLVLGLVMLPFFLLFGFFGLLVGAAAFSLAFLIPLAPLAVVLFLVWAVVRATRRPLGSAF